MIENEKCCENKREDIINCSGIDALDFDSYPQWLWDRLDWFQDLKFGLFMHWGIYSQWDCSESWPLVMEDTWARPDDLKAWNDRGRDYRRFRDDYRRLNLTFNPKSFAPEKWAKMAKLAGMKYVAFTTKHHDGFCMFDTKTTDYRITHESCPFHSNSRANIAKEVFDAFRKEDFAISCYFSKSDWNCPWYWAPQFGEAVNRHPNYNTHEYPEVWEKFVEFVHHQIEDLMSNYGHIDMLWLDGGQVRPPEQDIRMEKISEMSRKLQSELIVIDRTVGGLYENILTPEQEVPKVPLGHPWESCMTMGQGWSYREDDTYKSCEYLLQALIGIVAKGGSFLLNVGPNPDGNFAPEAVRRLEEIGRWMKVNSEGIYGTRAIAPYHEGSLSFTQKGDYVYVFYPLEKISPVDYIFVLIKSFRLKPGTEVILLGKNEILEVEIADDHFTVKIPADKISSDHFLTLKLECA